LQRSGSSLELRFTVVSKRRHALDHVVRRRQQAKALTLDVQPCLETGVLSVVDDALCDLQRRLRAVREVVDELLYDPVELTDTRADDFDDYPDSSA